MQQKGAQTLNVTETKEASGFDNSQVLYFSNRKVTATLLLITGLLLVCHVVVYLLQTRLPAALAEPLDSLFNLSRESNFPTYFSAFLLLFAGLLSLIVYRFQKKVRGKYKVQWMFLGLVLAFLSFDEAVQIHERLTKISAQKFAFLKADFLSFAWVIPYTILFLVVAVYFLRFVLALPKRTRNLFVLSGVLFIGGALGFEFIEGYVVSKNGFGLGYWLLATVEEVLEMVGVIVLLYALFDYMQSAALYAGIKK